MSSYHQFYVALHSVGVPLQEEWTPLECSQATNAWLHDSGSEELNAVFQALASFEQNTPELSSELKQAMVLIRGEHAA